MAAQVRRVAEPTPASQPKNGLPQAFFNIIDLKIVYANFTVGKSLHIENSKLAGRR